jgi:hypothetical protein
MKLTDAEMTQIYEEISLMRVGLDPNPNRGLQYVMERLTLCRAMQDRAAELLLRSRLALSEVLKETLVQKATHRLAETEVTTTRLEQLAIEKEAHATLVDLIKLQVALLTRTATDIRLLGKLTQDQIKLGEIDPEAAGLVTQVPVGDLSPVERAPATVEPTGVMDDVTLGPPSAIIDRSAAMVAATPELQAEPAVNFEDLFGELQHGTRYSGV